MTAAPIISHAEHLLLDPTDLCIPGYDGDDHAAIELAADGDRADTERVWPEVILCRDHTRARVAARHIAHTRDCADPLCAAAWDIAGQRAARNPGAKFTLIDHGCPPVLVTEEELRDITRSCDGITTEEKS